MRDSTSLSGREKDVDGGECAQPRDEDERTQDLDEIDMLFLVTPKKKKGNEAI